MQRIELALALSMLIAGSSVPAHAQTRARHSHPSARPGTVVVRPQTQVIDVNRPRTPFDCELPIGQQWYGSRAGCLAYLCGGQNVYNEYFFDADNRRRRNPCYGQNPTEFPE